MPTNPLPQRDMRVAEFMADKPNGERYEVRILAPDRYSRFEIVFIPSRDAVKVLTLTHSYEEHSGETTVSTTLTLWGARREIRKHRKRVQRMLDANESIGQLVYWERF